MCIRSVYACMCYYTPLFNFAVHVGVFADKVDDKQFLAWQVGYCMTQHVYVHMYTCAVCIYT